jgi:hypothetical protein
MADLLTSLNQPHEHFSHSLYLDDSHASPEHDVICPSSKAERSCKTDSLQVSRRSQTASLIQDLQLEQAAGRLSPSPQRLGLWRRGARP